MVFAAVVSSSLTQFLLLQFYIAIYFIFFFLDLYTYKAYGVLLRSLQLFSLLAGT